MTIPLAISRDTPGLEIICPNCKAIFPLGDVLRSQIEQDVLQRLDHRHEEDLEALRRRTEADVQSRVSEQFTLQVQTAREEATEQRAQNKELRDSLLELNRQLRRLQADREREQLKTEESLRVADARTRNEERERLGEEYRLKHLELEKQLQDAREDAARLRTRLDQGSQRTQGEVLELDLESQLRELFPADDIIPVKVGARGADLRQVVRTPLGAACGTILWEAKNARWQASWPGKLKEDMHRACAEHGVVVCVHTPDSLNGLGHLEGRIWAAHPRGVATLATVLRQTLIYTHAAVALSADKGERIEALYHYITSPEFRHRMEAIQEIFTALQEDDEKEKRWMTQKWARRDKQLRMVIDNVTGLAGDFEGLEGTVTLALAEAGPKN
jgi:hypothetical protein